MSEEFPLSVEMLLNVLEVILIGRLSMMYEPVMNFPTFADHRASVQALPKAAGLCRDEASSWLSRETRHTGAADSLRQSHVPGPLYNE